MGIYGIDIFAAIVTHITVIRHQATERRRIMLIEEQLDSFLAAARIGGNDL